MQDEPNKSNIKYIFDFGDSNKEVFNITINKLTGALITSKLEHPPEWTKLGFQQCPNCPLTAVEVEYCPAATALVDLSSRLGKTLSHLDVQLVVIFDERWMGKRTTAQDAIRSLMGLQIATSGCPNVDFLRPMARYHQPLATLDETLVRTIGMYFLGHYFSSQDENSNETFDTKLDGLTQKYAKLQIVNSSIAKRLRASGEITEMNALTALDMFAQIIPIEIDEALEEIRPLFDKT